jgi:hypothetical protein
MTQAAVKEMDVSLVVLKSQSVVPSVERRQHFVVLESIATGNVETMLRL